jgi:hypothetical protein
MNKLDISIIIPVHKLDDKSAPLLETAIRSVKEQKQQVKQIIIVAPKEVAENEIIVNYAKILAGDISIAINSGETDFCSQINFGVSQVETKYFSILELDDEYSNGYFKNVEEYLEAYPNTSGYLPITVMVNKDYQATHYVNEAVWAQGFSEQLGFLDMTSLLQYDNFMISGGVFSKEAFEEVGGLKSDIKLYFNYEFLLRFINSDFSTMVIPKLGYKHLTDRDDSLFKLYTDPINGIKHDEALFFKSAAKKEYFFNPNIITRTIKYSPVTA